MRVHIFGCSECGSELLKKEVKKFKGGRFCDNKDLEDYELQDINKEDYIRPIL
jgi:hypothetical protein